MKEPPRAGGHYGIPERDVGYPFDKDKISWSELFYLKDRKSYWTTLTSQSINELDLSVRGYNCLFDAGIHTVGALIQQTPEELLGIKNLGQRTLREIQTLVRQMGLRLNEKSQAD
jgi:DNA-directed RNA polymerase alpha subunit